MKPLKPLTALSLISLVISFTVPTISEPAPKAPFVLHVSPSRISAKYKNSVNARFLLENVSGDTAHVWKDMQPVPYDLTGPGTQIHSLKMECQDMRTNKEVAFASVNPPSASVAGPPRQEMAAIVPAGKSIGNTVDLSTACNLPPGDYNATVWYDTSHISEVLKPDPAAWHGISNKVHFSIHINP